MPDTSLIACHECDALQRKVSLPPGGTAYCIRCGAQLYREPRGTFDHTLSWAISSAVLLALANAFPIVVLEVQGQQTEATLYGAARALHEQDMTAVAALVFFTTIVAPGLVLAAMIYLLSPLRFGRLAPGFGPLFRVMQASGPWGMLEVFMLGILVALVKLSHVASVLPGVGMWAFAALMITFAAMSASYDSAQIWAKAEAAAPDAAAREAAG